MNVRDKDGNTPLLVASQYEKVSKDADVEGLGVLYYLLMKTSADALLANKAGRIPLHYAASRGEVVRIPHSLCAISLTV